MLAEFISALALLTTVLLQVLLWYKHRRAQPGIPLVNPPEVDAPRRVRTAPPTYRRSNRVKDRQAAAREAIDNDEFYWWAATRANGDRYLRQSSHASGSSEPRRGDGSDGLPGSSEPTREDESSHGEGLQLQHEPPPSDQDDSQSELRRDNGAADNTSSSGDFELVPETGQSDTVADS